MTENTAYRAENDASRNELVRLVNGLSQDQLLSEMPAGWNVIAVLAHLAFWDLRASTLIKKWHSEGIALSVVDTDVINEVTRPMFRTLDPKTGVKAVLDAAAEVDALIESLPAGFIQAIIEKGTNVHLNRAKHRMMHIEEIKNALAGNS